MSWTLAPPNECYRASKKLLTWGRSLGCICSVGNEGTEAYGVGLAYVLREQGIEVLKVNCADRSKRRLRENSDPIDAENSMFDIF